MEKIDLRIGPGDRVRFTKGPNKGETGIADDVRAEIYAYAEVTLDSGETKTIQVESLEPVDEDEQAVVGAQYRVVADHWSPARFIRSVTQAACLRASLRSVSSAPMSATDTRHAGRGVVDAVNIARHRSLD